jgi:hypothetical protein
MYSLFMLEEDISCKCQTAEFSHAVTWVRADMLIDLGNVYVQQSLTNALHRISQIVLVLYALLFCYRWSFKSHKSERSTILRNAWPLLTTQHEGSLKTSSAQSYFFFKKIRLPNHVLLNDMHVYNISFYLYLIYNYFSWSCLEYI